jgi:hypothetical protein
MIPTLLTWLRTLSRICGFETADRFPPHHRYARTRWNGAYFDIASDVKPEAIEQRLCDAIRNTPLVFSYITNPTPRMQRTLLGMLDARIRCHANANELVQLLINAYRSPHIEEAVPGLRDTMSAVAHEAPADQVRAVLRFLAQMQAPFDIIEMPA